MRHAVFLVFLMLCSCTKKPANETFDQYQDPAETARLNDEYRKEQERLAAVDYPKCDSVWAAEKLSACGRKVLDAALSECKSISGKKTWIDKYTGDSWQMRAGAAARGIDERLTDMRREHGPTYMESFAYTLGNGTDDVGRVICELSPQMRLTGVI